MVWARDGMGAAAAQRPVPYPRLRPHSQKDTQAQRDGVRRSRIAAHIARAV